MLAVRAAAPAPCGSLLRPRSCARRTMSSGHDGWHGWPVGMGLTHMYCTRLGRDDKPGGDWRACRLRDAQRTAASLSMHVSIRRSDRVGPWSLALVCILYNSLQQVHVRPYSSGVQLLVCIPRSGDPESP